MFNKTIELINITYTQDDIGQQIKSEEYRKVYAKQKSIAQSEFYKAGQTNIKPSTIFIIRTAEYKGETMLLYGGVKYSIYRIYDIRNEMIELYCEVRKGGN